MNYLQKKKLAFMSIVNKVKGFVRRVSGIPPLTLPDCVDEDSLIDYSISGAGVGDYDEETGKYKIPIVCSGKNLFDYTGFCKEYNAVQTNGKNYTAIPDDIYLDEECFSFPPQNYSNFKYLNNYPFKENTRYVVKYKVAMNYKDKESYDIHYLRVFYTDGTKEYISGGLIYSTKFITRTFVTAANKTISYICPANFGLTARVYIQKNIQLEEGTTATDYEPYVEPVTTNIYLDEPLSEGQILKNPVKLPTVKGTTIYTIDTSIQPSNMSATYYATSKE